jgi:hypothetical protein
VHLLDRIFAGQLTIPQTRNYGMLMPTQLANPSQKNHLFVATLSAFRFWSKKQELFAFLCLPPPFYLVYLSVYLLLSQAYLPLTFFFLDQCPSKPPPGDLSVSVQPKETKATKNRRRK